VAGFAVTTATGSGPRFNECPILDLSNDKFRIVYRQPNPLSRFAIRRATRFTDLTFTFGDLARLKMERPGHTPRRPGRFNSFT